MNLVSYYVLRENADVIWGILSEAIKYYKIKFYRYFTN